MHVRGELLLFGIVLDFQSKYPYSSQPRNDCAQARAYSTGSSPSRVMASGRYRAPPGFAPPKRLLRSLCPLEDNGSGIIQLLFR
jgi:hypothetical protein